MDTFPPVRVYYELDEEWYDEAFTQPFKIGRDPSCEVSVPSTFVSRRHAEVTFEDGAWWLCDLGSMNGLWLGEEKVDRLRLEGHTLVQLGWEGPLIHLKVDKSQGRSAPPPESREPARPRDPEPVAPPPPPEPPKPEKKPFWLDVKPESSRSLWPAATPSASPESPPAPDPSEPSFPTMRAPFGAEPPPAQAEPPPAQVPEQAPEKKEPTTFRAHRFTMPLEPGWRDATLYLFKGPVFGGVSHNVTVTREREVEETSLPEYASLRTEMLAAHLKDCMVLWRDEVELAAGVPASRVIFAWNPEEGLRLYQEQLYVLHEGDGYTMTASFSRKTRKKLGHEVERIMRSFELDEAPG